MNNVRLGVIGCGGMGQFHARNVLEGKVKGCELVAGCDALPSNLAQLPQVRAFTSVEAMLAARCVDAVIIATPHFSHPSLALQSLEAGVHVMVEKPIAVHVGDARMLAAAQQRFPGRVFGAMFNQRTDPYFLAIRRLVQAGELGRIRRVQWTITDWFRTAAYYAGGGWRATWGGEGGGVLLNQCPHNLDLLQWILGQPKRVTGFCGFGRYHAIEVEDDVTSYWEYPDGMNVTFIASTGEAPGTNRLEIAAERGRVVYERDQLIWERNTVAMTEFSQTTPERFGRPPNERTPIELSGHGGQHVEVLQNFVDAIRTGVPLIAPATEGVASIELANAILLSAWRGRPVDLPVDASDYERELKSRIRPA